ncbi:NUMOD4 domain-containing protein, partial [Staphylococcus aureus]
MTEIWKDIQGYEGLYEISDLGRVKSLPKMSAESE